MASSMTDSPGSGLESVVGEMKEPKKVEKKTAIGDSGDSHNSSVTSEDSGIGKARLNTTARVPAASPPSSFLHRVVDSHVHGDKENNHHSHHHDLKIEPPLAYREFSQPLCNATQEYLDQLMWDKNELRSSHPPLRHVSKLIDQEIERVVTALSASNAAAPSLGLPPRDPEDADKVSMQEKIFVPVDKYPRYNFVGRILGPRGMTAKQLEEETGCKIMVRGRGSCRTEPLHVLIHCEDYPDKVEAKLKRAVDRINDLLSPPPEGKDELKRKQLIELSIINGTYRPTTATKLALQTPRLTTSPYSMGSSHLSPHSALPMGLESNLFGMLGGAGAGGDYAKRRIYNPFGMLPPVSDSLTATSSPHSPPASPRSPLSASAGLPGVPSLSTEDLQTYFMALLMNQHSAAASPTAAAALASNHLLTEYYRQLFALSLPDLYSSASPDLLSAAVSSSGSSPIFASLAAAAAVTTAPPPPTVTSAAPSLSPPPVVASSSPHYHAPPPPPVSSHSGSLLPPPPPATSLFHYGTSSSHSSIYSHPAPGSGHGGSLIPPANLQQYLAAAAMLNNMPFSSGQGAHAARTGGLGPHHDGSGDAQSAGVSAHHSTNTGGAPGGGSVKRA